jgi:hypothetical protein
MSSNYPIEIIPTAAISEAIWETPALIVDTTGSDRIAHILGNLHTHQKYILYYTRPGINQLTRTIELANNLGIKCIVLCGETLPNPAQILPQSSYTASLISPGTISGEENPPLEYILNDPYAKEFSHIGYQIYRCNPQSVQQLLKRNFEEMRLGVMRGDPAAAEPMLRDKEHIFIDLRSVRHSDFPDNSLRSPNGLYAEELCQIGRYIGMGQKVKNIYLFGYPSVLKPKSVTGELIAEVSWHIAEGLFSNICEDPGGNGKEDNFLRKIVSMGQEGQDLVFVSSSSTGRWWMEIPDIKNNSSQIVPCSYMDYSIACSGEIPIKWLFFFQKINPD